MTEVRLKNGNHVHVLYYKTDDDRIHLARDNWDKEYVQFRTSVPEKVVFFATLKELKKYASALEEENE